MPRITLLGTLEVSLPRLGTIRATSCVTNALSTCTRGETRPGKKLCLRWRQKRVKSRWVLGFFARDPAGKLTEGIFYAMRDRVLGKLESL